MDEQELEQLGKRVLRFVWAGIYIVTGVWCLIAWTYHHGSSQSVQSGKGLILFVFVGLSVSGGVGIRWMRGRLDPGFLQSLLAWAVSGGIGSLGMAACLLGFPAWAWLPFVASSWALLWWYRP